MASVFQHPCVSNLNKSLLQQINSKFYQALLTSDTKYKRKYDAFLIFHFLCIGYEISVRSEMCHVYNRIKFTSIWICNFNDSHF